MFRPQNLVAAFLSAALLCTTGIALADKDKGGNHDKHGSSAAAQPGQSNSGGDSKAAAQRGPGGVGGPRSSPGEFDRSMSHSKTTGDGSLGTEFEGSAGGRDVFGTGAKAGVHVKLSNGSTHDFAISEAALNSLKAHQGRSDLIFFTTNGQQITAVCARGEKDNMRVTARTGDTFMLQDKSGQTREIKLDSKTASRLHVKVGSDLEVTAMTATSGKVVALDLEKKHSFDKFARNRESEVAKLDSDRQKVDMDTRKLDSDRAKVKSKEDVDVAKVDMDKRDVDIDQEKLDIDKAKGNKADIDADRRKLDSDKKKCDHDIAKLDNDTKKAKKSDVEVAKADVDTKGHKAKNRKSDTEVAKSDTDVAISGAGKCGHGSSRNGNPAYANQMAKDAANDASGHNPPGLPHECVNPAGHTRGFCKSSSSEGICGGGSGSGGSDTEVASNISKPCAPGTSSKSHGNPAFANQMAKDAANDASGHNPPGLPHECVNPAGHTRGFCKSRESTSSAMCGGGSGGGGIAPSNLHGGIASASVPAPGKATVPGARNGGSGTVPGIGGGTGAVPGPVVARAGTPPTDTRGGDRGPGAPVGMIPVAGGQFANGTRGSTRGASPTHVLGSSTGPTSGRRIAALPTRVLPVAIQPVGKRRCVWYKTGVLGASTGPRYIIGTSAISGKPVLHKKCR